MYSITSSTLSCTGNDGAKITIGDAKSGNGECQDNYSCISKQNEGPLPPGNYDINPPGTIKAHPKWLFLNPHSSNEMYGRYAFFFMAGESLRDA